MSVGIICEYNPFHNGHLHQINEIKKENDAPIVCVMSGNFTQRGEIAVADKYARAEMALTCGADIVLELPFPYCVGSAEFFASAGVSILASCGVDRISFGSECADIERLSRYARCLLSEEFSRAYAEAARTGGNARAYFETLSALSGDSLEPSSNDVLAIEYIKSIIKNGYNIEPCPIKREGSDYNDGELSSGKNPSATAIRRALREGRTDLEEFLPESTIRILKQSISADIKNVESGILLALRLARQDREYCSAISDDGLVNRIISSAKESSSYLEFEKNVSCKKYTDSSIRRAVLYILTGVMRDDLVREPAYTTLLGANKRGRDMLSELRRTESRIPIITKPSDAYALESEAAQRQLALALSADAIFTLALSEPRENGEYIKRKPSIIQ